MGNFMISVEVQYLSDFGDADGFTRTQLFSVEAETEEAALNKVWRLAKPRFKKAAKREHGFGGLVEGEYFIRAKYDGYPSCAIFSLEVKKAEVKAWDDTFSL